MNLENKNKYIDRVINYENTSEDPFLHAVDTDYNNDSLYTSYTWIDEW